MEKINKKNNSIPIIEPIQNDNSLNTYSKNNHKCIGPCFPLDTYFYNPINFDAYYSKEHSYCPINKTYDKNKNKFIYTDKCDISNISPDYKNYDILGEVFKFAITDNIFLAEIYGIQNVLDANNFITNDLETLPLITQERIINCIFNVYSKYLNFSINEFIIRLNYILENLYNIKISDEKLYKKIIEIKNNSKSINIFEYIKKKYNKIQN